jgi:hypothetical protein
LSVVCCQVEVSATIWSLVQRSPADCGASRWVWSRNLVNEEALAHWGLLRQIKKCSSKIYEHFPKIHHQVQFVIHHIITLCCIPTARLKHKAPHMPVLHRFTYTPDSLLNVIMCMCFCLQYLCLSLRN